MQRTVRSVPALLFIAAASICFAVATLSAAEKGPALPKDFRAWTHTKSMVIPDKSHGLYGFHNIYANKTALPALKKGGKFPEGSAMVVSFYDVVVEGGMTTQGKKLMDAYMKQEKSAVKTGGWTYAAFGPQNLVYWEADSLGTGYNTALQRRPQEVENFSQPHYEVLHEWRLGPVLTLNNTLFYVRGDGFFDYDGSWAPYSYFRVRPQEGFPVQGDPDTLYIPGALIRAHVTNNQVGWLPRLTWRHGADEIVAGGELRFHGSHHWGRLQHFESAVVDIPYDYHYYDYRGAKDIASLYVHGLVSPVPDLTVMANVQYAYNRSKRFLPSSWPRMCSCAAGSSENRSCGVPEVHFDQSRPWNRP